MSSIANDTNLQPLESYRIPNLPCAFYYIPNFLSTSEESSILENISAGSWVQLSRRKLQVYPAQLTAKNVLLSSKGLPHWLKEPVLERFATLGVFSDDNQETSESRIGNTDKGHGTANHVLINAYEPGEGIMPHEDGPAYVPVVATVSLAAPIVLNIYRKNAAGEREENPSWRILQEERSLLVTKGMEAYGSLLHGIADVTIDQDLYPAADTTSDDTGRIGIVNWELLGDMTRFTKGELQRNTRISLTYRDVLKVSSLGSKLFGSKK